MCTTKTAISSLHIDPPTCGHGNATSADQTVKPMDFTMSIIVSIMMIIYQTPMRNHSCDKFGGG